MSTDHRRLRRLSDAVVRAARDGDTVEVKRCHRHLTDLVLSATERDALVRQCQQVVPAPSGTAPSGTTET